MTDSNDTATASNSREEGASHVEVALAFEHVVKKFGNRTVLDDVSFRLPRGETLCVLGRSGTGKSVALRLMIGLLQADQGKVLVMGEDVGLFEEDALSEMRKKMGFLFQSAALFDSFSVYSNLALPLERLRRDLSSTEIKEAVETVLKQVGLEKDGKKMPAELSGGMQKRAGLARALVLRPEILLVDEPGSGLDRITASEMDDLLSSIKEDRRTTIVIVTHDIHSARRLADKVAVIEDGKLLAFGTMEELDHQADDHLREFISERGR